MVWSLGAIDKEYWRRCGKLGSKVREAEEDQKHHGMIA